MSHNPGSNRPSSLPTRTGEESAATGLSAATVVEATSPTDAPPPGAAAAPVSRWAIHRRLYDWVLSFAHSRHSTWSLFALSFAESSFFPIPPDVLLMPLCLGNRARAFWFATVCTVASVLGGAFGYLIGWGAWEVTSTYAFRYIPGFTPEVFARVQGLYEQHNFWVVFVAAFTPIP
ncbi:MAG: hypothetical protein NZ561_09685, partial [Phycisphaerae bacterium]|nr:hypothetical protein [Phycisphaerae bacterium]